MRAVLDTNVLISGLLWRGPPYECLLAANCGYFELVLSESILEELREKLLAKFAFTESDADAAIASFRSMAELVVLTGQTGWVANDPDDDKFIETALNGDAKLIVSGDRHLLQLSQLAGIEIVKPREFLARVRSGES